MAETRYELIDGELVYVSPALEPHAVRHSKVSAILEAFVADGYTVACDMLTRTSETSDMAPDASIYPTERDPTTGGRQLEELAFEVVSTKTLAHSGHKAARLTQRGVRRVFAVDVERKRGLEWSTSTGSWEILQTTRVIEDPCLVAPLPVRDLVEAAKSDDAVARALLAKQNPVIAEAVNKAKAEAKAEAVLEVLRARSVAVNAEAETRIRRSRNLDELTGWLQRAVTAEHVDELFGA